MPEQYSRGVLKMVIAQICQMIGWHSINSTPLEFLVDLMQEYLLRVSKVTHQYAEVLGRTEANLDDLGLAFQHMHVLIPELSEYVRNVDSVPCMIPVPKFPVCRENHLNFLKPGSQEVVTRPVHVHEHLPAMYPETEESTLPDKEETPVSCSMDSLNGSALPQGGTASTPPNQAGSQSVFKRPGGPLPSEHSALTKRSKIIEEGRPLREIHSVIMTTSGFLSPAREGKLPESRTPHPARADSPPASSYPMVPPELKTEKKPKKIVKKGPDDRKLDKENKKKNRVKELFKPDNITDFKAKKLAGMKELTKLKPLKSAGVKGHVGNPGTSNRPVSPQPPFHKETPAKALKTPPSKVKPERLQEVPPVVAPPEQKEDNVDKLPSEPDKQKLNIFKKISKPREEKIADGPEQLKYKDLDSRESSPGLIIDENLEKHAQRSDVDAKREEKRTPRTPEVHIHEGAETADMQSHSPDVYIFDDDDMSPPGTPSTPKTPELSVPAPVDLKKKKKERNVRKKEQRSKSPKRSISPKKVKSAVDVQDSPSCDRPKTPQAIEAEFHKEPSNPPTLPFPFFPPFPSAPGLIPHPLVHPMFPRYPLPMGRGVPGAHPAMPNLPIPPRFLPPSIRPDDCLPPKIKAPDRDKVLTSSVEDIHEAHPEIEKFQKSTIEKVGKAVKPEKETIQQPSIPIAPQNNLIGSSTSTVSGATSVSTTPRLMTKNEKNDKLDKNNKKSKDHKKERKDKFKKKKDKKEKHKIKDKVKGKKGKLIKLKDKKDKKEKRKDKGKEDKSAESVPKITLKLALAPPRPPPPASPRPPTPDNPTMKKITIKPPIKKPDEEKKRDPSPELAKISPLVTRPPKAKVTKPKADAIAKKNDGIDDKENGKDVLATQPITVGNRQVWICPACGNQDDGSPMIGCDDCDAWYHWVCVGVQVPPADHEDWYCRLCIAKKQELHHDKKKKKRKKKVKALT